jgi:hypothetical protein
MKFALGKGFLLALTIFVVAELVTAVGLKNKASGLTSFGYEPESGIVEHEDGRVEFLRSWGRRFYDQVITAEPSESVHRIFTLGDSVPRGKTAERSYAGLLGQGLAAAGAPAESLNLAIPGYGSRRIQIIASRTARYQPDLVILHLNSSNEYEDERDLARYQSLQSWHPRNWLSKSKVIQKLRQQKTEKLLWRYLPARALELSGGADSATEQTVNSDPQKQKEWLERTSEVTRETVTNLRAEGIRVLIVSQCRQMDGKLVIHEGLEEIAQSMVGDGVRHFAMSGVFTNENAAVHFADGSHLRPSGHEILAQALVPVVQDLLR